MTSIIEQDYIQAKESFNKGEIKILKKIIKLKATISKAEKEIGDLFKETSINSLDVEKYENNLKRDGIKNVKYPRKK